MGIGGTEKHQKSSKIHLQYHRQHHRNTNRRGLKENVEKLLFAPTFPVHERSQWCWNRSLIRAQREPESEEKPLYAIDEDECKSANEGRGKRTTSKKD